MLCTFPSVWPRPSHVHFKSAVDIAVFVKQMSILDLQSRNMT